MFCLAIYSGEKWLKNNKILGENSAYVLCWLHKLRTSVSLLANMRGGWHFYQKIQKALNKHGG